MKSKIIIATVIILFFGGFFIYNEIQNTPADFITVGRECNLSNSTCKIVKSDTYFELTALTRPIRPMEKMTFLLKSNINKSFLKVKLFATNMNMGTQELTFEKIKDDEFELTTTLPSCITGNMIWRMEIQTEAKSGVAFEFLVK